VRWFECESVPAEKLLLLMIAVTEIFSTPWLLPSRISMVGGPAMVYPSMLSSGWVVMVIVPATGITLNALVLISATLVVWVEKIIW
jgi:hypothetical protein